MTYSAGIHRPSRTAKRRVAWMVFALVSLGLITFSLIYGAAVDWIALSSRVVPAPDLGETIALTFIGTLFATTFFITLVMVLHRIREHFAKERAARLH